MYLQSYDIDDLFEYLKSGDSEKILFASMELSNIGKPVVSRLVEEVREAPIEKKEIYASVLSNIGEEAVNEVISLLRDNKDNRLIAAIILRDIGKSAIPLLVHELKNKDPEVGKLTAEVLGEIKDQKSLEYLRDAYDSVDNEVKIAIEAAIKEIEKPLVSKVIDSIRATSRIENIVDDIE